MAAVAGALEVKLEKRGFYVIGEGLRSPNAEDCVKALKLTKLAALLFATASALLITLHSVFLGWFVNVL